MGMLTGRVPRSVQVVGRGKAITVEARPETTEAESSRPAPRSPLYAKRYRAPLSGRSVGRPVGQREQ